MLKKPHLILCFLLITSPAYAEKVCLKISLRNGKVISSSRVVTDNENCPRRFKQLFQTPEILGTATISSLKGETGPQGETGLQGETGPQGEAGPQGAPGEDGSLRIYGDGSSGDLIVQSNRSMTVEELSAQFENCLIETGVTFQLRPGVTLRCRGTFTNRGNLSVVAGLGSDNGGFALFFNGATAPFVRSAAGAFSIGTPAGSGIFSASGGFVTGGRAESNSVVLDTARMIRDPLYAFGGGGAPGLSLSGLVNSGGSGGGGLLVLAKEGISNEGIISANGASSPDPGAGGGAGGTIILASPAFVINTGTLEAQGGNGANASANVGFGGGGSGGFIHLISPSVTEGTTDVTPGLTGTVPQGLIPNFARSGGGAGGSSVNQGAPGGSIRADNTFTVPLDALSGGVAVTNEDPTSLF